MFIRRSHYHRLAQDSVVRRLPKILGLTASPIWDYKDLDKAESDIRFGVPSLEYRESYSWLNSLFFLPQTRAGVCNVLLRLKFTKSGSIPKTLGNTTSNPQKLPYTSSLRRLFRSCHTLHGKRLMNYSLYMPVLKLSPPSNPSVG